MTARELGWADRLFACSVAVVSIAETAEDAVTVGVARLEPGLPERLAAALDPGRRLVLRVEGEIAVAASRRRRERPARGGLSLGPASATLPGTLGGALAGPNGRFSLGLTNAHVLAPEGGAEIGAAVYQPALADRGAAPPLGRLERILRLDPDRVLVADAALIDSPELSREVIGIGQPRAVGDVRPGDRVRISGRSSGVSTGIVVATGVELSVRLGDRRLRMTDQLQYVMPTDGGDSGALLFRDDRPEVVGLHMAASRHFAYGNRIARVLDALSGGPGLDGGRGPVRIV